MALRATQADEKPASARAHPFPGPWPPAPGPWPSAPVLQAAVGHSMKRAACYCAGFHSPTVFSSGSENHAKVPPGMLTGGTSVLPPNAVAWSRQACTSSTCT